MIKYFLETVNKDPHRLFLLDGIGAFVSTLLYIVLFLSLHTWIGVPRSIFIILAVLAASYTMFSLINYFYRFKNWRRNLRITSLANLLHCVLTVSIMVYYSDTIQTLGIVYFVVEICIVIPLAYFESKSSRFMEM